MQFTKSALVLVILVTTFVTPTFAQPPDTVWTRTYGNIGFQEYCKAIKQTPDGGFVAVGAAATRPDYPHSVDQVYLVRLDTNGDTLWTRTYGNDGYQGGEDIVVDDDSGFFIVGQTNAFTPGQTDIYVLHVNAQGDTTWSRRYGGLYNELGNAIELTNDGNLIIAGSKISDNGDNGQGYALLLSADGDTIWTHEYGTDDTEAFYDVKVVPEDGFIFAGTTGSGSRYWGFYLVRTDEQGNILWTHTHDENRPHEAMSVAITSDGGFVAGGYRIVPENNGDWSSDFYMVKLTAEGDTTWTSILGGYGNQSSFDIKQTSDMGFILAGFTKPPNNNISDALVIKTDSDGIETWNQDIGGSGTDAVESVIQTTDGGFAFGGSSRSFTDTQQSDFYLIKMTHEASINELTHQNPRTFLIDSIFPNPFNPQTRITISVPFPTAIAVRVYNLAGQEVGLVTNRYFKPGIHTFAFDGAILSSGTYIIRATAKNGWSESHKVVLLR